MADRKRFTLEITLQDAVEADGNGALIDIAGFATGVIQIIGTFGGTITFEGSQDGVNFVALALEDLNSTTRARATSDTGEGMWLLDDIGGLMKFRARVSAYSSGNITVKSAWSA